MSGPLHYILLGFGVMMSYNIRGKGTLNDHHCAPCFKSDGVPIAFFNLQIPFTGGGGEGLSVCFNASSSSDIKLSSTAAVYASGEDHLEQGRKRRLAGELISHH